MSYGLPPSTEINTKVAKNRVIEKFGLAGKDRKRLEESIHKITICNEISPRTVNIPARSIRGIFVLRVELKQEKCDADILEKLFKLIGQKMVMVLEYGVMCRPVVFHELLVQGEWRPSTELTLPMKGLDLDAVWENLVIYVGSIDVSIENDLSRQILADDEERKREEKIEQLRRKMMSEKQPRKKRELFEKIRKLEMESEDP